MSLANHAPKPFDVIVDNARVRRLRHGEADLVVICRTAREAEMLRGVLLAHEAHLAAEAIATAAGCPCVVCAVPPAYGGQG